MANLTIVVAGFPELATAAVRTGQFKEVITVASTGELRNSFSKFKHLPPSDLVFCFADDLLVDTPQTLENLVQLLVERKYNVILLEFSPLGRDLANRLHRGVGLLEGPFYADKLLGAVNSLGFAGLAPVGEVWGGEEIMRGSAQSGGVGDGWETAAPQREAPMAPMAPAWQEPSAPAAPAWQEPAAPMAPPVPVAGSGAGWETTTNPPGGNQPGWDAPVIDVPDWGAPAPEPELADWGGPSSPPGGSWETAGQWGEPGGVPSDQNATPPQAEPGWGDSAQPQQPYPQQPQQPYPQQPQQAYPQQPQQAYPQQPQQPYPQQPQQPYPSNPQAWDGVQAGTSPGGMPSGGMPPSGWDQQQPAHDTRGWDPHATTNQAGGGYDAYTGAAPVLGRGGYVIVITAPSGGVGKSTISTNLAAYMGLKLRQLNKTVCLIDTNPQNPDVSKILGQYTPNVVDLARHANNLTPQIIQANLCHRKDLNLDALLGPYDPAQASPLVINSRIYNEVTKELRKMYDYIIIDSAVFDPYDERVNDFIIPVMDYMLVLAVPNFTRLHNISNALSMLVAERVAGGFGVSKQQIGYILNQAQEGVGCSEEDVRQTLAEWRYLGQIPMSTEWLKAINDNTLIATKNYVDLNRAFDQILYQVTNEQIFVSADGDGPRKKGLMNMLPFGKKK